MKSNIVMIVKSKEKIQSMQTMPSDLTYLHNILNSQTRTISIKPHLLITNKTVMKLRPENSSRRNSAVHSTCQLTL